MKLQLRQHFFYDNKLYETNDTWSDFPIWGNDPIITPDRDEVIIATGKVAIDNGYLYFDRNGYLDRDDGPAVDCIDYQCWYKKGKKHRIGAPAEHDNEIELSHAWYVDDVLHRDDGPAIEVFIGEKQRKANETLNRNAFRSGEHWYVNGQRHRLGGPAIIWSNGYQAWYQYNKCHRTDGPAVTNKDGSVEWWVDGEQVDSLTKMLLQYQTQSAKAVL